jgi:hypothetical protein
MLIYLVSQPLISYYPFLLLNSLTPPDKLSATQMLLDFIKYIKGVCVICINNSSPHIQNLAN